MNSAQLATTLVWGSVFDNIFDGPITKQEKILTQVYYA